MAKELPELYELRDVFEDNPYHFNESVFDHIISVLEELKGIYKQLGENIKTYLNQKIDTKTRWELLFLATVLHDIAKKDTIVTKDNENWCPEHEAKGAEKAKKILERFDVSEEENQFVASLIREHLLLHVMFESGHDLDREYKEFKTKCKGFAIEMILLAWADLLGTQYKETDPEDFKFRINFYKKALRDFSH